MERFFISGCQRSGTTLLRLILESHPTIQCFDEAVSYDFLVRESLMQEKYDFSRKPCALLLGFKIPRFAEQLTWQEFMDPDYGRFPSFYKGEKVIHVVRNVQDVVASMMKLRVSAEASWLEEYGVSILAAMACNPNVGIYYKKKYDVLSTQGMPQHLIGALYWEIKNQGLFDLLKYGFPVYALHYEKLVISPRDELLKICRFLGVDWSESLLEHPAHSHAELDEQGRAIGGTDPCRGIDTKSIGGHQDWLTDIELNELNEFVYDFVVRIDKVIPQ